jgi:hypothetical protein
MSLQDHFYRPSGEWMTPSEDYHISPLLFYSHAFQTYFPLIKKELVPLRSGKKHRYRIGLDYHGSYLCIESSMLHIAYRRFWRLLSDMQDAYMNEIQQEVGEEAIPREDPGGFEEIQEKPRKLTTEEAIEHGFPPLELNRT